MNGNSRTLAELRPPGPISPACKPCVFFEQCGGLQNSRPLLNCFDQFCCGHGKCDFVCPNKPADFRRRMAEIGGLRFDDIPELRQKLLALPKYIPMIHHPYRRVGALRASHVALDPYKILRLKRGKYESVAADATALRNRFKILTDSQVVLRGTAEDTFLERFWSYRNTDRVPEQMARLNISLFIGPNYSHFLDAPRTDLLFNRKRQLLCLAELSKVGVSVVPHLSAVMPADWKFWLSFLQSNAQLRHVALNFQTGYRTPAQGRQAIDRVVEIQQAIGRGLSLILIGGAQFVEYTAPRLQSFTVIDSQPFEQSLHRKVLRLRRGHPDWEDRWTLNGQPVDHILQENSDNYSSWIQGRSAKARKGPLIARTRSASI